MAERTSGSSTAARLGKLETRVEGLADDLHGIRKTLERMEDRTERGRPSALQMLAGLASAAAIAALVVRLGATGYLEALTRHETELGANRVENLRAAEERGRAAAMREHNAGRLDELEAIAGRVAATRFSREDGEQLREELRAEALESRRELKAEIQRVSDRLEARDRFQLREATDAGKRGP